MATKQTISINVTKEELGILLIALQEIPAKICNPLSEKLKIQAQEQLGKTIEHKINENINIDEKFGN